MGAPQTPKTIEEDDCVPRLAVVEEVREAQQQERKLERRRGGSGPRRRGLENELEGERRRPRRKPARKRENMVRNYKKKGTSSRDVDEQSMIKAIDDILENNLSLRKSAAKYGVNAQTL